MAYDTPKWWPTMLRNMHADCCRWIGKSGIGGEIIKSATE